MKKSILFVMEQSEALDMLMALLNKEDIETVHVENCKAAYDILENEKKDMVITDSKLPSGDGFELLDKIKMNYPEILRIAMCTYSDSRKALGAIEKNVIKLSFYKPWNDQELVNKITKLFELEHNLNDKNILELINNIDELPTVPILYNELSQLIEEDVSIDEIARKLEEDQSISSKILKVANSAFYGAKTGSIIQAIMYIGLINVKNIVLTNSIFSNVRMDAQTQKHLWDHVSLSNKMITQLYVKILGKKLPNQFASAGLLHDIGKVVILNSYGETYKAIITENGETDKTMKELEAKYLGVNHQEIGGYLLNWWDIPVPIVESALYHHDPLNDTVINKELVMMVHLANYYTWKMIHHDHSEHLNMEVFAELGVSREIFESFASTFAKENGYVL